jgi:hypothetical protein
LKKDFTEEKKCKILFFLVELKAWIHFSSQGLPKALGTIYGGSVGVRTVHKFCKPGQYSTITFTLFHASAHTFSTLFKYTKKPIWWNVKMH